MTRSPEVESAKILNLKQSNDRKKRDAARRANQSLMNMIEDGTPISIASLAVRAGVSRSFIYSVPDLLKATRAASSQQQSSASRLTTPLRAQRGSEASLQNRLADAVTELKRLRAENQELKDRVVRLTTELTEQQRRTAQPMENVTPLQRPHRGMRTP